MVDTNPIRNVSDTALWVAIYRAMESERPDALFQDPYARRLGGERGQAIVEALPCGLGNELAAGRAHCGDGRHRPALRARRVRRPC